MHFANLSALVQRLLNLNFDRNRELQEIVDLTSEVIHAPIVLINLVDEQHQYVKFKVGMLDEATLKLNTFCKSMIAGGKVLIVPDAAKDDDFKNSPLVTQSPYIRFYAGAPLTTQDEVHVGSLCIMDTVPRRLHDYEQHLLSTLAKRIMQMMEFDMAIQGLRQQVTETREAENKLRAFFNSEGSCHMLLGRRMEVIAFNKKMEHATRQLHGIDLKTGMLLETVLDGEQKERFQANFSTALHGKAVKYEREMQYANEKIWWAVNFEPGYNEDHEIIGVSYVSTNITERKRQEEALLKQNEVLRKIAFIHSHELRRPVASVLGLVEIFKSEGYKADAVELQMLEQVSQDLDGQVRQIIAYTEQM